MNKKAIWIGVLGLLWLLIGCDRNRVDLAKRENVALGDIESARVMIDMGTGELNLNGGAEGLMTADFRYNVESWEPEIEYEVDGRVGQLSIAKPDHHFDGILEDDIRYEWDVRLNDDVPTDLDLNLGVGKSDLILSGMALTDLNIDTGIGQVTIDLSGDWSQSFDVTISGGIGMITVIVPGGVGVLVETERGIGHLDVDGLIRNGDTYTNEAYGESDVTITIDIGGGIGNINVELENF